MNIVTAYVPIFECGYVVAEMSVEVRPAWDDALGGLHADISFEDAQGDLHPFPEDRGKEILAEIKRSQPSVWKEIEEVAEASYIEGCAYDQSPHYAEDTMEAMTCPR